jgi:hypothetical protein
MQTRRAFVLLMLLALAGCSTGKTVSRDRIAKTIADREPTRIRLNNDPTFEIRHPRVRADTLFGTTKTIRGDQPASIPLAAIESGAIRQNDRRKARIAAMVIIPLGIVFFIAASSVHPYVTSTR